MIRFVCIQHQLHCLPVKPTLATTVARVTCHIKEYGVDAKVTTWENSVKVRFNCVVHIFQIYLFSLLKYTMSGSSLILT